MFENKKPKFEMGKILKIDMLECLSNYPRDFIDIYYKNYSDGIIEGCNITISDNFISLNKGIVKYNGNIYMLNNEEKLKYECNNKYMIIKIRFFEPKEQDNLEFRMSEIVLEDNLEINYNEMEICRFKLREGARLRDDYVDFTDFSTEFDTVDIINAPYAGISGKTLSPQITSEFGRELLNLNLEDPYDISFAFMLIQNRELIEKEAITAYIRKKISIMDKELSNDEMYKYLLQILNTIKNNGDSIGMRSGRRRKILLD